MRSSYLAFLGVYLCCARYQESSAHPPNSAETGSCAVCGPHAVCHPSTGTVFCTCPAGFYSESGDKKFASSADSTCKDYDECYTMKTICGPHASCHNTVGRFFCLCHPGFARLSGETNFTGYGAGCQDVNECLQQPCGPHGVCSNAEGSFRCSHTTPPVTSDLRTTLSPFVHCLSDLLKNQSIIDTCFASRPPQPPADQFCSLINSTLAFARRMCEQKGENRKTSETSVTLKDVTSFGNKFVADGSGVESATVFLGAMERFATLAALASPTQELKAVSSAHLDLDVRVIDVTNRRLSAHERLTLRAKNDTLDVYMSTVTEEQQTGVSVVVFLSYTDLRSLQRGEFVTEGQPRAHRLTSSVVSVVIGNRRHRQLRDGVNITLRHTAQAQGLLGDGRTFCVYWNHSTSSHWSAEGCEVVQSNSTHTTCGCQHLSSFALLIATSQEWSDQDGTLALITLVGLSASLACLALAVTSFLCCVQTRNLHVTVHINLCVAMFLGELLFLLGVEWTTNKALCGVVAGCLHYLFLVACAWMCVEGLHLHVMVRNLQRINAAGAHRALRWFMYPFSYGLPAVIVVVSAATYPSGYGSRRHCWLAIDKGLIWSFIGPVGAIILFNMALFIVTLGMLRRQITRLNAQVTKIKDMRMLALKAIAQGLVLGCSWILSLFHFQDSTTVLTYMFTIIHSLQGTLIFLILCVFNPQVREGYRSCWNRACGDWRMSGYDTASTSQLATKTSI